MRKVYYATHPGHDEYRWFTRSPHEPYVMIHKNALSRSPLESHSFYGDMEFQEVTVKGTVEWLNHVFDNKEYISQTQFEQSKGRTTREPKAIAVNPIVSIDEVENQYRRGDVVIGKNKNGVLWLIQLGSLNKGKWELKRGFKLQKEEVGKKPGFFSTAFLYPEDIQRPATEFERQYLEMCYIEKEVLPMTGINSVRDDVSENVSDEQSEQVNEIIQFGSKRKKEKVKSNKVNLTISKIKTVEI